MVLPRPAVLRAGFRPSATRFGGSRVRSGNWRHAGRRTYADAHGPVKASSDLPWIIGSTVVTVPSAMWLWQQGPKKGSHGHDEHGAGEGHEEGGEEVEEKSEAGEEEVKEAGEDGGKQEESGDTGEKDGGEADTGKDDSQSGDSGDEGGDGKETPNTSDDEGDYEKPGPNAPGQINKNDKKGPGEEQKGERAATETQAERGAQKEHSGSKNPYIDDPEKSKKGEGVTETAKIHGTVDPKRPAR